jgi:Zn-dependent protease
MEWYLLAPLLILSIVVHEVAHAWVARREGDDTAERMGRITLNPLRHLDPVGSVLVPLLLVLLPGNFLFGWAKPVLVDTRNYRDPVWSDIRVSMAGPASNFLLALVFTLLLVAAVLLSDAGIQGITMGQNLWIAAAYAGILVNLVLGIFNLIPIPPLDGSHVMRHLLPAPLRQGYDRFGRVGVLVILGVLFLVPGVTDVLLLPIEWATNLFLALAVVLLELLR